MIKIMLKYGSKCQKRGFFICSSQKMSYLCHRLTKASGTLDEWLSQWSAKPCTAVRIRQVPQRALKELFFYF